MALEHTYNDNIALAHQVDDSIATVDELTEVGTPELLNHPTGSREPNRSFCLPAKPLNPSPCRRLVILGDELCNRHQVVTSAMGPAQFHFFAPPLNAFSSAPSSSSSSTKRPASTSSSPRPTAFMNSARSANWS